MNQILKSAESVLRKEHRNGHDDGHTDFEGADTVKHQAMQYLGRAASLDLRALAVH